MRNWLFVFLSLLGQLSANLQSFLLKANRSADGSELLLLPLTVAVGKKVGR
jgi:hypothetical protein